MTSQMGIFGPRRTGRVSAALALGLAIAVLGTACKSSPGSSSSPSSSGQQIKYPLPDPGAGPDRQLLPAPAQVPGGSALAAAGKLASQVAGGGRSGLAALLTALKLGGITLVDTNGARVLAGAKPASGVEIGVGEVIAAAGQNGYDHGLTGSQIASTFDALFGDKIAMTRLRSAIFGDLAKQGVAGQFLRTIPKTTDFMSAFIIELGLHARPANNLKFAPAGDVKLTGLQTWLLWLSLASGFFDDAVAVKGHHKVPASPAAFRSGHTGDGRPIVLTDGGPCTVEGTGGKILDAFPNLLGPLVGGVPLSGWDGVSSLIGDALGGEANPGKVMDVGAWTAVASVVTALAHLAAEGFGLKATMEMVGGEPLVRTKETHEDGAEKTIKLTLTYDIGKTQWANCLRQVLNVGGVDLSLPNNGPVSGATVDWHLPSTSDFGLSDFVQFDLHGRNPGNGEASSKTNDSGEAMIDLQGKRQRFKVPEGTRPFLRYVTITAGIQTKDSNLFNDLNDAVGAFEAATGGPAAVIASIVPNLIDRSEALSTEQTFKVRDWPPDFKIDSAFEYSGSSAGVVHLVKCNGVAGDWNFEGPASGLDFTMDSSGLGHGHGFTVTLVQGDPAFLNFRSDSGAAVQKIPVIPGNYQECQSQR